jgi:hypothetical protein
MIEILTFRLAPDVGEEAFLAADKRVQVEFAYQQPGLQRRTTARAADGEWTVVDLWRSAEEADATEERWDQDPVCPFSTSKGSRISRPPRSWAR